MEKITNTIHAQYAIDGSSFSLSASNEIEVEKVIPTVLLAKTSDTKQYDDGSIVTYTATLTVGTGSKLDSGITLTDLLNDTLTLIEGSVKLDGECIEVEDLKSIIVAAEPNSEHTLEYQCLVTL